MYTRSIQSQNADKTCDVELCMQPAGRGPRGPPMGFPPQGPPPYGPPQPMYGPAGGRFPGRGRGNLGRGPIGGRDGGRGRLSPMGPPRGPRPQAPPPPPPQAVSPLTICLFKLLLYIGFLGKEDRSMTPRLLQALRLTILYLKRSLCSIDCNSANDRQKPRTCRDCVYDTSCIAHS